MSPHLRSLSKDDDVLLAADVDDLGVAVWVAGVVDEACGVAHHGGVHHVVVVHAEHVATDVLQQHHILIVI
jgi:hypothetical protein